MTIHHHVIVNLKKDDFELISKEHKEIERYMKQLRDVCDYSKKQTAPKCKICTKAKHASCDGLLPSYLHYLYEVTEQHFSSEEKILSKKLGNDELAEHKNAHTMLLGAIENLVIKTMDNAELKETSEIYREVYKKTMKLFSAHDKVYDISFKTKS